MEQKRSAVKGFPLVHGAPLRIHYRNPELEERYADLWLWCWDAWDEERDIPAAGADDFGAVFELPRGALNQVGKRRPSLGFKVKDGQGADGVTWYEFDRRWRRRDGWEVFVTAGDPALHPSAQEALRPRILGALIRGHTTVEVVFDRPVHGAGDAASYRIIPAGTIAEARVEDPHRAVLQIPDLDLSVAEQLVFAWGDGAIHAGLCPAEVMDAFTTDAPLGALPEDHRTRFSLWAPRATQVTLELANSPQDPPQVRLPMTRGDAGVWHAAVARNLHGTWYQYRLDGPQGQGEGFRPHRAVNDPWSFVAQRSGVGAGRSMVVDLRRIPRPRPLARRPTLAELVAWEIHVRDLSGGPGSGFDRGDPHRRAYLAFTRGGTRGHEGMSTGLDHLVELGVNAVQLLPIQEFPWPRHRYRWGYLTANFMAPEGSYATDEASDARLREVVAMVDALHARGIAVICDVVFNHTAEGDDHGPAYNLRGMDSKYFYRQDPGSFRFHNGSGVGNELATERPMARRLVVDACRFWVERMGVDGFRFDLASLIDLETLKAVEDALPEGVLLYGEPWAAGRAWWGRGDLNAWERWAVFDDVYRDAVKGPPEGSEGGFVQGAGDPRRLLTAVSGCTLDFGAGGAWAQLPTSGLRYLTCHDNLTLHDKLKVSVPGMGDEELRARMRLAAIIQLTSLGPVLLHGGVEMARTKPYHSGHDGRPQQALGDRERFDANSYKAPDAVNNLDWRRKARYALEGRLYAGLIRLRTGPLGACLRREEAPTDASFRPLWPLEGEGAVGWLHNEDRSAGPRRWCVLVNPSRAEVATFDLDLGARAWRLVCDGRRVEEAGLGPALTGITELVLTPLSAAVLIDDPQAPPPAAAPGRRTISGPFA